LLRVHPQDHNVFEIADEQLGPAESLAAHAIGDRDLLVTNTPERDESPNEEGPVCSGKGRHREGESPAYLSRKRSASAASAIAAGMLLLAVIAIGDRATKQSNGRAETPDRIAGPRHRDHGPTSTSGLAPPKRRHPREPRGFRSGKSRSESKLPRRSRPSPRQAAQRAAATALTTSSSRPASAHAASERVHEFSFER
jgi:hypothetical protein